MTAFASASAVWKSACLPGEYDWYARVRYTFERSVCAAPFVARPKSVCVTGSSVTAVSRSAMIASYTSAAGVAHRARDDTLVLVQRERDVTELLHEREVVERAEEVRFAEQRVLHRGARCRSAFGPRSSAAFSVLII